MGVFFPIVSFVIVGFLCVGYMRHAGSAVSLRTSVKTLLLALCCIFSLTSCRQDMAPIENGVVVNGGALGNMVAKGSRSWPLSKPQLEQCAAWLKSRESGWHMVVASPPFPSYSVLLVHTDGSRTQVDMFSVNESWRKTVHVFNSDKNGKFIFGGMQQIAEPELETLKNALTQQQ